MADKNNHLDLDSPDNTKCWLISFNAHCRNKSINDVKSSSATTSPMTDKFLEMCGHKAILKVVSLLPGKSIELQSFSDINKVIQSYIQPKERLVIAERTNFLQLNQSEGETETDFLTRLNSASEHCKWEDLANTDPCAELIKLRFIAGLRSDNLKLKVLEKLQMNSKMTVAEIVDFCQMSLQVQSFVKPEANLPPSETMHVAKQSSIIKNCKRCGKNHKIRECPAFNKACNKCGKPGHFANCCMSKSSQNTKVQYRNSASKPSKSTHNVDVFMVAESNSSSLMQQLVVNNVPLQFQVDTGAEMSIMSRPQWEKLGSPILEKCCLQPVNYDDTKIKTLGCVGTKILYDGNEHIANFIVVESSKAYGLLGRNIINHKSTRVSIFASECEYLPTIKGFKATMSLTDDSAKLKFFKARPVPFHVKPAIEKELEVLVTQGVLTPVDFAKHASPVVWVKKSNGRYRMCADFKALLNNLIQSDAYPLPSVEEIFAQVGNATKFAKIDLKSAYSQIELDDEAKKLSVINTSKGLFILNRLQMGMKNASAIFQRCMEHILKGLPGVIVYQDDVLVCAENESQLQKRLSQTRKRLADYHVTINEEKSVTSTERLTFLGFSFSKDGIKPDKTLTEKILQTPRPATQVELASFLGLVNYYGRFMVDFAELCVPLNELKCSKGSFVWSEKCEKNFNCLKERLVSEPVLKPFCMEKKSVLAVDASMNALGAVLSQDGHPVMFVSKKLSPTERGYSNIEREALAVVWACKRLKQFLLGKKFEIQTDHRPLLYIFNSCSATKTDISPRMLRLSLKMMQFDYDITYIKGCQNVIADSLSRCNFPDSASVCTVHFSEPAIYLDRLKEECASDPFLQSLMERIIRGNWSRLSQRERPFKRLAYQLTIDEGVVRCGSKIVPPSSLYNRIMGIAHQTHNGVDATLTLIQKDFYWPGMRRTVEQYVHGCASCNCTRFRGTATTHRWPSSDKPWSRLHMDWAYHKLGGNILVLVDSTSGWLEAAVCANRSTSSVINHLRAIFARFGIPTTIVTDNAPEFSNEEMTAWLRNQGCTLMHSPEYHPQSNGLAERMVRVIKDGLKCYSPTRTSFQSYLQRLLFVHRNTAQRNGKTPAQIMIGHEVRCPILAPYAPMQPILYRRNATSTPEQARFIVRHGTNTSLVAQRNNRVVLAHDNQIASFRRWPERQRRPPCRFPATEASGTSAVTSEGEDVALADS